MGETVAKTILGQLTKYQPGVFFNSAKFFDIEYQTYGDVPNVLHPDGSIKTFYWELPAGEIAIRINYDANSQSVTGMNALGIRQRQEVWQQWITQRKSIQYVLEHLPVANFDPEFFKQYETAIVAQYNIENPQQPALVLKAKKGLFNLLRR